MSKTPYAVTKKILGKEYNIVLNHLVGARIDAALRKMNAGTGEKTTITGILKKLVAININLIAQVLTPENATEAVYEVLDISTLLTILPLAIQEPVTEADVADWLDNADAEDGLDLFGASLWLTDAGVGARIVVVADPKFTLLVFRLLRGVATEAEIKSIMDRVTQLHTTLTTSK
jgi:hypothetical protein